VSSLISLAFSLPVNIDYFSFVVLAPIPNRIPLIDFFSELAPRMQSLRASLRSLEVPSPFEKFRCSLPPVSASSQSYWLPDKVPPISSLTKIPPPPVFLSHRIRFPIQTGLTGTSDHLTRGRRSIVSSLHNAFLCPRSRCGRRAS